MVFFLLVVVTVKTNNAINYRLDLVLLPIIL